MAIRSVLSKMKRCHAETLLSEQEIGMALALLSEENKIVRIPRIINRLQIAVEMVIRLAQNRSKTKHYGCT